MGTSSSTSSFGIRFSGVSSRPTWRSIFFRKASRSSALSESPAAIAWPPWVIRCSWQGLSAPWTGRAPPLPRPPARRLHLRDRLLEHLVLDPLAVPVGLLEQRQDLADPLLVVAHQQVDAVH